MSKTRHVWMPLAAAVLVAGTASAQTNTPWSVSFDLGAQGALSGDVHAGGSGTVLGLPTQVEARSYGDVYDTRLSWTAGLGYRVGQGGEVRVQGGCTSNTAESTSGGTGMRRT